MENKTFQLLGQYGHILQQWLFPRLEESLGALSEKLQLLVKVLGLVNIEAALPRCGRRVGRPAHERVFLARAFVAKAILNLPTTRALIDRIKADIQLRRLCGWEWVSQVPDETIFSRAFAEFATSELPQRLHEVLIRQMQKDRLVGHISRDATAIAARERVPKAAPPAVPQTAVPARPAKEKRTRIERQATEMTLEEMLAELPRACAVGCKTNSHGRKETWRGYKLHLDVADGQVPISALLTSANLHDSQAAIPLALLTAQRVTNLYDLMDSAYDCQHIEAFSRKLNHVPIIEKLARGTGLVPMAPHQAGRYCERTSIERVNARLKDEFGGRYVRVRGVMKVMAHLMFGLLVLTVDELLRLYAG